MWGWIFAWLGCVTTRAKGFITYIIVTMPAANVLAADVFGIGIFD
jgi:hypothetical protein